VIAPEHRGVKGEEGVDLFDGEIGAIGQPSVLRQELFIGVGAFYPFRAKAFGGPGHVAGGVGGLHRRDHRIAFEEGEIVRVNHLGVFDAPAAVVFPSQETAVGLEHQPVGAVANGMRGHLVMVFQGFAADVVVIFLTGDLQSLVSGIVGIGFQHQGAP